jgi:hypothetical protein
MFTVLQRETYFASIIGIQIIAKLYKTNNMQHKLQQQQKNKVQTKRVGYKLFEAQKQIFF